MIIEYVEPTGVEFEGTIIDIESIGEFNQKYRYDSRNYMNIKQVILGYITSRELRIYCATSIPEIDELKQQTPAIVEAMSKPFYAFNCSFESGVLFHHSGLQVVFDGELQGVPFERKKDAILQLKIPNYDDPFFDLGYMCIKAWNTGEFKKAIAHNRACLLKERDILIKRGFRDPEKVVFIK